MQELLSFIILFRIIDDSSHKIISIYYPNDFFVNAVNQNLKLLCVIPDTLIPFAFFGTCYILGTP